MEENEESKLSFPEDLEELLRESKAAESTIQESKEEPAPSEEVTPAPEEPAESEMPHLETRSYSRTEARKKARAQDRASAVASAPKGEGGLKAAVCYLGGWVSGLIVFMTEKDSPFIRFHAIQSLLWSVSALFILLVLLILTFGSGIVLELSPLRPLVYIPLLLVTIAWTIGNFVLYVNLMVKAFSGEWYKLPVLGDKAEELS